MKTNKQAIVRLVGTAIFAALVIVLQVFVVIPLPGGFTITLTMVPIIVGAILFGPAAGAFLGGVFGAVVSVQVVTGLMGLYSFMMFEQSPVLTVLVCLLKGIVAGWVAGWLYKLLSAKNKNQLGVILAAVAAPICNTGIFVIALATIFNNLVNTWVLENAYENMITFLLFFMVGANFLVEFAVNVILIPVVTRVLAAVKAKF